MQWGFVCHGEDGGPRRHDRPRDVCLLRLDDFELGQSVRDSCLRSLRIDAVYNFDELPCHPFMFSYLKSGFYLLVCLFADAPTHAQGGGIG